MKIESKHFMDWWSYIYVIMILLISLFISDFNIVMFILYFVLALPFINSIEHFVVISLLLSTISYYFTGAYEEIYSIYTILMILIMARVLFVYKGKLEFDANNLILIIILGVLACWSYIESPFHYFNGLFRLLYLLLLSVVVGNFIRLKITVICEILPTIASVMVIGYLLSVLIKGSLIDGRLTIANTVNTNTFGMSCAQLGCILLMTAFLNKAQMRKNLVLCAMVVVLALLSGSRGALMAFALASAIVVIIYAKKNGRLTGTMFKLAIIGTVAVGGMYLVLIFTGLDTSRFSVAEIIASGGSRRSLIYESLIPYIIKNGYWKIGYGPGHECSRQVIMSLIGWDYAHSHNTFLEAFGELGIMGLLILIWSIKKSLKNIYEVCKIYKEAYLFVAILICLLINGIAESYFFDAVLWLLLGICRNNYIEKTEITVNYMRID